MSKLEELKSSLVEEVNKRMIDKIIEPTNAELLIKLINNADSETEALAIAELGTTYRRTGFHFDKRLEKIGSDIKYFVKNEELSFVSNKDSLTHKLIIGDNYDALLNLMVSYKGEIDIIYIDPPYGSDSMGEFANTNYTNSISRDNLLSMLYPRFVLAKSLMAEDGILCCSIDDLNASYVKCLMDDVFGEHNFVGQAPRKTCEIIRQNADDVCQRIYDYVLIYKNDDTKISKNIVGTKEFPLNDGIDDYYLSDFQNSGDNATRATRPNLFYPIYVNADGTLTLEKKGEDSIEVYPKKVKGEDGRWLWKPDTFREKSHLLVYINGTMKVKRYKTTELEKNPDITKYQTKKLWLDSYKNAAGTSALTSIIPNAKFSYPKPVDLIKFLINLHPSKDTVVLDFFAGSGTTGHAVLDLNREDNGTRKFILCTNNEITDSTPNGIAYDVTSKRLKRIMTGSCYDGDSNFNWLSKNDIYGGNLEVCDIKEVNNAEYREGKSAFEVIDETLYDINKFDSIEEKINWVCNNFEGTQKYLKEE